ncbi:MAG TPA: alpha-amylase family glycosyl hydrolase [Catalimonadaceae bacterium]|nr:alpha-amylase family glycosyl hydrolase [Catalimonadaceae bacterium]
MLNSRFVGFVWLCLGWSQCVHAQNQSLSKQGYVVENDTTTFLFNAEDYNLKPSRVVVTGAFRNWDQNMADPTWTLQKKDNSVWKLKVYNPNYRNIPVSCPFKFRVDDGRWLDPPYGATNTEGGNLIYMKGLKAPSLKAEIHRSKTIWAWVGGHGVQRPLDKSSWKLTDAKGVEIPIASVLPNDSSRTLITPAVELDIRRVYYLEIPAHHLKAHCSFDGWMRDLYSDKELGANVNTEKNTTTFRLFAPRALKVILYTYSKANDSIPMEIKEMDKDKDAVWETTLPGDLHGTWYDYTVHGHADPGNFFFETHPVHITDPYARVVAETNGKARVWHKTKPASPLAKGIPKLKDLISYEVHIEDFTSQLPVPANLKGTIPAMTIPGLKNAKGQKIGFDHLCDLGINAVHLMPMQEFWHFPDAEWKSAFEHDPYMKEQGINLTDYNWGYMTSHAFTIESHYRDKKTEHGAQREQFRDLVQNFHNKNIAVIVDFVFNHTMGSMQERDYLFHFTGIDQQYYYRTRNLNLIGEYGNETKSENRPMVQRWIIDQFKHFIKEFGVDGFRIDLAGQTDQQTLKMLRQELGPDVIIYGEPWIASNDPDYEANPDWDWYKSDAPICYFNDDARNAFKGPVSNPNNKKTDRGYAGGNFAERENAKRGLSATFPDEKGPLSGIKYLDIHDNWALADQFAEKDWDGRQGVDEKAFKLAATLLFTCAGPVVLHGGTEFMRSKGLSPLEEVVKKTALSGDLHYHGKRDTYNLRFANQFVWDNVGKTKSDKGSTADYASMLAFWKGMLALRNSQLGKVFRQENALSKGYYQFIEPANDALLGYLVDGKILVLLNVGEKGDVFPAVSVPKGKWKLVATSQAADLQGVRGTSLKGGVVQDVSVPAKELRIWVLE